MKKRVTKLRTPESDRLRFEAKFIRSSPEECWLWTASTMGAGYGCFSITIGQGGRGNKVRINASRAAWLIYFGEIPDGLHVLHRCDNPPCVNPNHLFLGTPKDNSLDRDRKGRTRSRGLKGEEAPWHKLTVSDVTSILKDLRGAKSIAALARQHNVSRMAIYQIKSGRNWAALSSSLGIGPTCRGA
jgi:hypothetical protein